MNRFQRRHISGPYREPSRAEILAVALALLAVGVAGVIALVLA